METFNKNFIDNWKDLQNAKIGMEFEWFSNFSYIKTIELLNLEFSPIEVWGFNHYHSDFEVTDKSWKIEPDYSGGSDMVELISGPTDWVEARLLLIRVLNFINKYGYTDDHCSIHINISFNDLDMRELNPIKLIMNFNEDFVYSLFPNRRNNIYAKSIKWIIPFEDWENSETAMNSVIQCMQIPDDTKYYGINLQKKWKGWLEYRYVGGADYQLKQEAVISLMDYFILQTKKAITEPLIDEDNIKLLSYLEDNINWFKQYKTYNDFLGNIDGIEIQLDGKNTYELINSEWSRFKNKIFEIIKSCESIKHAVINYNSTTNRIEIVDALITNIHYLKGVDFVNCVLTNVTIYNCDIVNTPVTEGHIYNCNIYESEITNCKLQQTDVKEYSKLIKCMFDGGLMDGIMEDGVFRSGIMGPDSEIKSTVKMVNKDSFWNEYNPNDKKIKSFKK